MSLIFFFPTLQGEEIHASLVILFYLFIFIFSLTTDKNRGSQKTRVPAARLIRDSVGPVPGVRVHCVIFLLLAAC